MSIAQKISERLNLKSYTNNSHLLRLSAQLRTRPENLLIFLLGVLGCFFVLTRLGQCLLFVYIVYAYPIYKSVQSLEDKEKGGMQKWLSYWIILGFFFSFHGVVDRVISYLVFPRLIKTAFFFYLYCPLTNGYVILYELLIRRCLRLYESKIDRYLSLVDEELKSKGQKIKQTIAQEIIAQSEKKRDD